MAPDCAEARECIHAVLDGDLLHAEARQELDRHLSGCAGCREAQRDFRQIQDTLRGLPGLPLSGDALDEVLARTSRATTTSRMLRWGRDWRTVAAAAALAAALWTVWPTGPAGPDQAQVDQAAAEARMVILLTAQALSRTQRAALREVMTDEISPALSRVPMNMPTTHQNKDL